MARALILVDVQNDFCAGGSLPVAGGAEAARRIAEYVSDKAADYDAVVATADWHDDPGEHFATEPDYVDTWPPHCRVGSDGALFHPAAEPAFEHVRAVFRKGLDRAAYSGFEGTTVEGDRHVGLADWLRARAVTEVDVAGIATDHCVRATALDAAAAGFRTTVLLDLTAGVATATTTAACGRMAEAGVLLVGEPLLETPVAG